MGLAPECCCVRIRMGIYSPPQIMSSMTPAGIRVTPQDTCWWRQNLVFGQKLTWWGNHPNWIWPCCGWPRHSGSADFVQPLSAGRDGAEIFVIGHPEGLRYTLSTGIISGLRDDEVQISAAVSPGNSGGPVYDHRGNLIGIVSSKFDRNRDANAENLSFAAKADGFQRKSGWTFRGGGQQQLDQYLEAIKKNQNAASDRKN